MRARRRLALAVLLLAGAPVACDSPRAPGANVVLVLVDQLRADAVEQWMPETAELAGRGVTFEGMRSVAPWTYPSVISMFSGLYPQQHGADGHRTETRLLSTFDERLPVLPRLLKGEGYYTAGFVTNPFLHTWNPFHLGFDHYAVAEFINSQGNLRGFGDHVWTADMFADTVNSAVLEHFEERPRSSPEFTYVHYIDVHGPWDDAPFPGDYESAVRYTDGKIKELYDFFSDRYDGDFIFLVTSDHGQELGDELELGEGPPWRMRKRSMHEFNLRIPFLVLPSDLVPEGRTVSEPCANVDVFPTLLDWLGFDVPKGIPGKSLLPAIRGGTIGGDERSLYALMSAFNRYDDCVLYRGRKYVRYLDPRTGQERKRALFALSDDPQEIHDLGRDFGAAEALLERAASPGGIDYPRRFEAPPDEVLEQLKDLGYME